MDDDSTVKPAWAGDEEVEPGEVLPVDPDIETEDDSLVDEEELM